MLDRSTHRRRRAGAPMKYLAHSASFHSGEKSAPSKPGTKHIAAMEADHDAALRDRQRLPVCRTPIDEGGSLLRELGLAALGDSQDVLAQRRGVHAGADRQDVT